jgi:hypothetical protein
MFFRHLAHFHKLYLSFSQAFVTTKIEQRLISRFPFVFDFSNDFSSGLVLSIVVNEVLFMEGSVFVINDQHALGPKGDPTLVANICSSKRIITCDHDHSHLSLFKLIDGCFGLGLQLVLKNLKAIKKKFFFSLLPSNIFVVHALKLFAGYSQHSISI